jgi:cardiolipin synthase
MWRKNLGIYPFRYNNQSELLQSGNSFFEKLSYLIKNAVSEIHIQIYIFEPDTTGVIIKDLLLDAAKRGVKIYVVLDAYGSKNFNKKWQEIFTKAGIELYFYSPIKFGNILHMGMRLHHKIICIDNQFALIGGINISDNYSSFSTKTPWLDFAIFVKGKIVHDLLQICFQTLRTVTTYPKIKSKKDIQSEKKPIQARVLQNNWVKFKFGITHQYKHQIRKSEKEITLFASYFIPSFTLKKLLKKAEKRGVNVQIVLASNSDVGLAKYASEYFYIDMLKSGIKLYEWKPSVLHAKVAIIDSNWFCVGSYNLNHLSDFGSIECNLEILDKSYIESLKPIFNNFILKDCDKILLSDFNIKNTVKNKFINFLSYNLYRFLLLILFILQSKNSRKARK